MKQTAVEWLAEQLIESHYSDVIDKAKEMQEIEKLKRQLFMGKVSEIIGMNKTIELWKECIETFKSE